MKLQIFKCRCLAGLFCAAFLSPVFALDLNSLTDIDELTEIGSTVNKLTGEVTVEQEIEMGGNLVSGLLGAAPLVDDDALQRYVNDVGLWIASRSDRPSLPWAFGVIDSPGINAFAAPGGYIVVTVGLFNLLENEAQLAGVLAHEIAHVVEKHHLDALESLMKRELWGGLAVKATTRDKKDKKKLNKLIKTGVQLYSKGLDRDLEFDADLRGVVLTARAGYDPYALLDVLTTIDSINPDAAEITVLLNTHPPANDRLNRLAASMDGRLDAYATGQANLRRFKRIAEGP